MGSLRNPSMAIVTLTTDFGLSDSFVGIMKGVMLRINPDVTFVDITHEISPQNIRQAAYVIASAFDYFPKGSIHLSIVDPGVGTGRRPIAVYANGHYFVGPDNGLFTKILRRYKPADVVELENRKFMLPSVSNTFHGRDIFAPVAGWLSKGEQLNNFGSQAADPKLLDLPAQLQPAPNLIEGEVIHIDHFGNAITNITQNLVEHVGIELGSVSVEIAIKSHVIKEIAPNYSVVKNAKKLSATFGSFDTLELFLRNGDACSSFDISIGDHVEIRFY